MGGGTTSTPVLQALWTTFKAVPVLPIQPKLRLFSVLVREQGSFRVIGDLGSLCAEGDSKDFLHNLIALKEQSTTVSHELGSIDYTVGNDSRCCCLLLLLPLLVFRKSLAGGGKDVQTWRISAPSHQSVSVEEDILMQMLDRFVPDKLNPHFASLGKSLDVWIVTEVITAPSLAVYSFDEKGDIIGLSLPPVDLQDSLQGQVGATAFFRNKGPEEGGKVRPLPFAFRGWKYKYEHGFLKNPKRAHYEADSFHNKSD